MEIDFEIGFVLVFAGKAWSFHLTTFRYSLCSPSTLALGPHRWSAKDSSFSALSVPAEANMMVVSKSAMMPETALAAVMQACVPLFPACRADSTMETWGERSLSVAVLYGHNLSALTFLTWPTQLLSYKLKWSHFTKRLHTLTLTNIVVNMNEWCTNTLTKLYRLTFW